MVLTGVDLDENGKSTMGKLKTHGDKVVQMVTLLPQMPMDEYTYQIKLSGKELLTAEERAAYEAQQPIVLAPGIQCALADIENKESV